MMLKKTSLILMGLFIWVGSVNSFAQETCIEPPREMKAWFPFDEESGTTTQNLVSGGNSGTLVNGPTRIDGKVANALMFDGTDRHVTVANQPQINVGTGNFSVDAWIQMSSQSSGLRVLLDKRQTNPYRGIIVYIYNGRLGMQISNGVGYTNYNAPTSSPYLANGQWQHIAITVNRANTNGITFYVNGVSVGNANPTGRTGNLSNSVPLKIGNGFQGGIDEVELFNRVLSASEIAGIYNAGEAGKCKNSNDYNECCPPSYSMDIGSMLFYQSSGSINSSFNIKFIPTYQFKKQMKTYVKYANSVDPTINTITMNWKFKGHSTDGDSPGPPNTQFLQSEFIYWNIYGNSVNPTGIGAQNIFFDSPSELELPFQPGIWYSIHVGTYFPDNNWSFFSKDCSYRVVFLMIPEVKSSGIGKDIEIKMTDKVGGKVKTIRLKKNGSKGKGKRRAKIKRR